MTLTRQDETDLLTAVHDGPFEQPLWSTFLDRLRARVRADHAGLVFRPPDRPDGLVELHCGGPAPDSLKQVRGVELREGRVYDLAELAGPGAPNEGRVVRVTEPGGVSAWLGIARGRPAFTASDGALLSALVPHLTRALRNYVALDRERFRADLTGLAMQRLNFGWLSFDASGRVLESTPRADRLLEQCTELRKSRHGRLTAVRPALERDLTDALRGFAGNPGGRPRALRVSRDPWLDMLLVPAQGGPASATQRPVAIAYLQGDTRSFADRHQQIAELFGLLPSEARLALALSRGLTIAEAAADLGLTIETARNYSKKIYAKTGARGQPDLVRFILAGVLAFA